MDRWEKGMLAKSLAGHDKGCVYLIVDIEETEVLLSDGARRPLSKVKRKKKKHVQLIRRENNMIQVDDAKIRSILNNYRMMEES